jgi:thymidylate synthase
MSLDPTSLTSIKGDTLASAWEASMRALLFSDVPLVDTQRGTRAKELVGMRIEVTQPMRDHGLPRRYPLPEQFVEDHWTAISDATAGVGIASRINRPGTLTDSGHNQVDAVVEQLETRLDSRRAVIVLWDGASDPGSEHPPCACLVQFLVREGRLSVVSYLRSNDAWVAAVPDMVAMVRLGKLVADRVGVPVGEYIHFAASYHIYEPDLVPAMEAFREANKPA